MSEDINVTDGTVLEALNNKVDLDGGNYKGSALEDYIHKHCSYKIIGEIVQVAASLNYVPEGTLYCDGAEKTADEYPTLWTNYIEAELLDTCTYAEYETDLAIYGQCIKWAVDLENQTFRIPFIKDGAVIQQAGADSIGKSFNAGLPNITGNTPTLFGGIIDSYPTTGSFRATREANRNYSTTSGSENGWVDVNFDASLSNPIYGNSDTVQMNAVAVRHFVVVSNGSINESQRDWSQYESGLVGKANTDLSNTNPNASFRRDSVRWGIPDYEQMVEIETVSNTTTTYAAVKDGIVWGKQISGTTTKIITINGKEVHSHRTTTGTMSHPFFFPLYQGDIIVVENTTFSVAANNRMFFAPFRE